MKTNAVFLLLIRLLTCFAVFPTAQAVSPAPDGGYPGGNTAEGQGALSSLTTGTYNTAIGLYSLLKDGTGKFNTGVGAGTLLNNLADENAATGAGALLSNGTGFGNTANGAFALFNNTDGGSNTAIGNGALFSNTIGGSNTATGVQALYRNTVGGGNIAYGDSALFYNDCGNGNIAIGVFALGQNMCGSGNIDIANPGVFVESNAIRIGDPFVAQFTTYIAGITGTAVVGDAVVVDGNGQLGTVASAARFKKEIRPMDKASEGILALKPVSFQYKSDSKGTPQFGLITEEVAKVNADLVVRDRKGEIYSVRYEAVNAMLLNEFIKEHKAFVEEQDKVKQLKATVSNLVATVKEQASQIEKVNARFEMNESPRQIVFDGQ
jgi:hypothetical protein